MPEFLFLKNCSSKACTFFKKETLVQVFSCGFGEIVKSTVFHRTPPMAALIVSTFSELGRLLDY